MRRVKMKVKTKSEEFLYYFSSCGTQSNFNTRKSKIFKKMNTCFSLKFLQVNVRQGRKHINEKVFPCAIQCLAYYKVSIRELSDIFVSEAHIIFDQKWTLCRASDNDNYSGEMTIIVVKKVM